MARVYTTTPGATVRVGTYGEATGDVPVIVPDDIAKELAADSALRVESDPQPPAGRVTRAPSPSVGEAKDAQKGKAD